MIDALTALELQTLMAQHGIGLAVLFGSRARGTAHAQSDVDVGVLSSDEAPLSFRALASLRLDLERIAACEVDVVDLATADCLLRFELISDGRVLHADTQDRYQRLVACTLIEHDDLAPFLDALVEGVGRAAAGGGSR